MSADSGGIGGNSFGVSSGSSEASLMFWRSMKCFEAYEILAGGPRIRRDQKGSRLCFVYPP